MTELKQSRNVRQAACDPSCGFLVRSPNEQEIVRVTRAHIKDAHQIEMSDAQIASSVEDAPR